jgi:hypothetical protein
MRKILAIARKDNLAALYRRRSATSEGPRDAPLAWNIKSKHAVEKHNSAFGRLWDEPKFYNDFNIRIMRLAVRYS